MSAWNDLCVQKEYYNDEDDCTLKSDTGDGWQMERLWIILMQINSIVGPKDF